MTKKCLAANLVNFTVELTPCNLNDLNQKWEFGYKNMEKLNQWETYGAEFREKVE